MAHLTLSRALLLGPTLAALVLGLAPAAQAGRKKRARPVLRQTLQGIDRSAGTALDAWAAVLDEPFLIP